METTGQSLLDFWTWAARKGLVSPSVANDLRAASKEVLSVEDNWLAIDIKALDIDYLLVRFDNLRKFKFKPQSLSAYKSRFKKARNLYLAYLDNPSGWHYPDAAKKRRPRVASSSPVPTPVNDPQMHEAPVVPDGMVSYPFPLRPGVRIDLNLPPDLTREEADRLSSYIKLIVP